MEGSGVVSYAVVGHPGSCHGQTFGYYGKTPDEAMAVFLKYFSFLDNDCLMWVCIEGKAKWSIGQPWKMEDQK